MKEVKKDESAPPAESPTTQLFTSIVRRIHELPGQDKGADQAERIPADQAEKNKPNQ